MFCPGTALLDSLAIVALFLVIGEFVEQLTGKIAAESAVLKLFAFAAGLYRALITPERLHDLDATFAVHLFAVFTGTAYDSTSRFDHIGSFVDHLRFKVVTVSAGRDRYHCEIRSLNSNDSSAVCPR